MSLYARTRLALLPRASLLPAKVGLSDIPKHHTAAADDGMTRSFLVNLQNGDQGNDFDDNMVDIETFVLMENPGQTQMQPLLALFPSSGNVRSISYFFSTNRMNPRP